MRAGDKDDKDDKGDKTDSGDKTPGIVVLFCITFQVLGRRQLI